jgi:precorrin-3B synthase
MIELAAKRPLAGGFTRRGACPALSAPMATGDGLLVRLNPVAGGLSPKALIGLCEAAAAYGNGIIEVTTRGSVQVRGLTESSAAMFAQAVDRLGIAVRTGVPVQTGVLAGLDPGEIADPTGLAESIRIGISRAGLDARLGPKVSVVVDGGGRTALADVAADVRLTALDGGGWQVAIAGDAETARTLGVAGNDQAASDMMLGMLSEVAAMGRGARARDLSGESLPAPPSSSGLSRGSAAVGDSGCRQSPAASSALTGCLAADPRDKPEDDGVERASLIGITSLRNGYLALGVALPFGHTTADRLKTFAETAARLGVDDIRPAPGRTLVVVCKTPDQAKGLREQAEMLDFITSPDDPRQSISACPGAPECASGHIPARQMAAEIAKEHSEMLDGSMHLHVSGCTKGCAHPGKADLVLVGSQAGIGLVVGGTARDEPLAFSDSDRGGRGVANLARLVSAKRREDETTAQAIKRIGLSMLAEAFGQGEK